MAAEIDSDKWEPAPGPVNPRSASAAAAAAAAGAQAAMAMLQARSEGAAGGQAGSFGSQPKSKAKSSNSAGAAANMSLVCQVCVLVDGAALFFVPLPARMLCDIRVFGQGGSCSSCVNNFGRLSVYPSAQGAMYHCARDVLHVRTHSSNGCCGADGCVLGAALAVCHAGAGLRCAAHWRTRVKLLQAAPRLRRACQGGCGQHARQELQVCAVVC